jgi:SAM-dependent methyltransferase
VKILYKISAIPGRLFRSFLCFVFEFDRWHINTLYDRAYARDIIQYVNLHVGDNKNSLAEIGCGLGDIIRNVNYNRRVGYDMERNVLRAARFLSKWNMNGKVHFEVFEFPDSTLNGKHDVLILVNWIHHIAPEVLRTKLEEYFTNHLNTNGELIIDTVHNQGYKYNHSIDFLVANLNCELVEVNAYEIGRKIFAIKKIG